MYGAQESTAGGMVLVAAGLTTGAWVLAIVGLALAGIAPTALIRKPGPHRP